MNEYLIQIYNTLLTIETKGESTIKMAGCLDYLKQIINALNTPPTPEPEEEMEVLD